MVFHDEVEIEDFTYDEATETYTYPCPCGDIFRISKVSRPHWRFVSRSTQSYHPGGSHVR
jgi:hypothetical protein